MKELISKEFKTMPPRGCFGNDDESGYIVNFLSKEERKEHMKKVIKLAFDSTIYHVLGKRRY